MNLEQLKKVFLFYFNYKCTHEALWKNQYGKCTICPEEKVYETCKKILELTGKIKKVE